MPQCCDGQAKGRPCEGSLPADQPASMPRMFASPGLQQAPLAARNLNIGMFSGRISFTVSPARCMREYACSGRNAHQLAKLVGRRGSRRGSAPGGAARVGGPRARARAGSENRCDRCTRWLLHCEGSGKPDRARSRLYRGEILQKSMRLKALAEIDLHSAFLCRAL